MQEGDALGQLIRVLNREEPCPSLTALIEAIEHKDPNVGLLSTAIGLDSSVFLRLPKHAKSSDIVDYLGGRHPAPLILPGQTIQEFWNNQLQAIDTVASGMRKQFDKLTQEIQKAKDDFGDFVVQFEDLLTKFNDEHGQIYDGSTMQATIDLLRTLDARAIVAYAPRNAFTEISAIRKRTKTPPGFQDDGDGDFFVWVDFLTGLQRAALRGTKFDCVALVTNDVKIDWSRKGVAHPILAAEIRQLFGVPFEIWTINQLAKKVDEALTTSSDASSRSEAIVPPPVVSEGKTATPTSAEDHKSS